MKYRNFVLRLIPLDNGAYNAVVTDSPHGNGSIIFRFAPGLDTLKTTTRDGRIGRDLAPESAYQPPAGVPGQSSTAVLGDQEQVGNLLFDNVFSGKVGDLFKKAHDPNHGLRIKLVLQDATNSAEASLLHRLPWELLFYERHLGVSPSYSIVRDLDGEHAQSWGSLPLDTASKPRILIIGANPHDTQALDLEREKRILTELACSSAVEIEQLLDISLAGLHDKLEEGFDVVHFMGHGALLNDHPVLLFTNAHGDAEGVSGKQLVEEIRGLSNPRWPRLFVLNACHGGTVALGPGGLTGIAAELDRAGAPAVVAMRQEISDDAAICFSRNLYQSLATGLGLDEAMAIARLALKREHELAADWATPCLYANLDDGRLFTREPLAEVVSSKQPKPGSRRGWLLATALGLLALAACLFFLLPRSASKRLVLEPLGAGSDAGLWDNQTLVTHLSAVAGLKVVKDHGDFNVQIALEAGMLRAMVTDQRHHLGGEIMLSLPDPENKAAWERLHAQLAERIFELLGLVAHGPPGWFLINAETKSANNQGVALLATYDLAAAEAVFRKALEHCPSSAAVHANLAMTLNEQGRYGEALTHATKAVVFAPDVALFHYNLGLLQVELGKRNDAVTSFERALKLDSGNAAAANALAKIYIKEKNWDRARLLLDQAIRCDSRLVSAHKNLGRTWLERGFAQEALVHLDKALALAPAQDSPQMAEILILKARAQHASGDDQGARQTFELYDSIPNVALLSWHGEMMALAQKLAIEPKPGSAQAFWSPLTTGAPLAFFTQVSGKLKLSQGGISWYAQANTALAKGTRIEAGAQDRAFLVCAGGGVSRLEGPGAWAADQLVCSEGKDAGALFHALLAQTSSVTSIQGLLSKGVSRLGRGNGAVLAPRGFTANLRPELRWLAVEGASAYELTLEGDVNFYQRLSSTETQGEMLVIGSWKRQVCRLPWPDEVLLPDSFFSLAIKAFSENGTDLGEMRADVTVLSEAALAQHDQLLQALEPGDQPDRLAARVAVYASCQLWAETIAYQQELVKVSGRFEEKLELASIWLKADLDVLARESYTQLVRQAKDPEQRAELEWGFGVLDYRAGAYPSALVHLGRARALFRAAARDDKVIAVDYAMADTRSRIKE